MSTPWSRACAFTRAAQNTGTHVGNLWTSTGVLLATVTFTGETASGWQQASFSSPVLIRATRSTSSPTSPPNGHYSVNNGYFTSQGVDNGPLHALAAGPAGANGLFSYGADAFPTTSYSQSNYWVDVVTNTSFTADTTPPTVVSYTSTNNTTAPDYRFGGRHQVQRGAESGHRHYHDRRAAESRPYDGPGRLLRIAGRLVQWLSLDSRRRRR